MRKKVSLRAKVSMVYKHFQTLWSARYGSFGYRFSGIDRTHTSEALKSIGTVEIKKRVENYFNANDNWLVEHNHPYRAFIAHVDWYEKRRTRINGAKESCQRIIDRECFDVEREIEKWSAGCNA